MIREPKILCGKLGLTFNNPDLFLMALTHRSAGAKNNERLEFLGDSILGFVIAEVLYDKFPCAPEGVLSRLRANLVNQGSLAELAREHRFGDYLLLGSGELKSGGFRRESILSDALEAVIGALYLDQGMDVCKQWIKDLFQQKVQALSLDNWQKDPKTQLQELMQSKKIDLPEYTLLTMSGLPHEQTFKVKCTIPLLKDACIGTGVSRKRAEQAAAEKILQLLEKTDQ
ncbi:ribonuclease III [Methylomicrobium lacus]|uniref:ribonuclease III n=1 Tax=Methylomicrobium lacus TaxID=136992 RepID=UPI00045E9A16|nr:ribonuclease III [Methylomicrobium lacus]